MVALKIADVKDFMEKLLKLAVFDNFLMSELEMNTFVHYEIKGHLNQSYYNSEEASEHQNQQYVRWSDIKPFVYQMVRGTKTPLSFHILLLLTRENVARSVEGLKIPAEDVQGMYIDIKFDQSQLYLITRTGRKSFTLDKSLDQEWDLMVKRFLKKNDIPFEEE